MRSELKAIYSGDVDMKAFEPDEPGDFGVSFYAEFGPLGHVGGDTFTFLACSPTWMQRGFEKGTFPGSSFARGMIILFEYDCAEIERLLERLAARCSGATWDDIAAQLNRFGQWEFDEYQGVRSERG
jgi:hypothetical protein